MPLFNEYEILLTRKKYNVLGVPEKFNKAIVYNNDIYLPIEAFNLTRANVISYMTEYNSGDAIVGITGEVYLSGQTALDMCAIAHPDKSDELEECISKLFEKTLEAEALRFPVNQTLL
jgi:hypothetical protein